MGLIKRLPALTPAEFSAHWRGPHGMLGKNLPNVRRYYQNHVVSGSAVDGLPDSWGLDGFSELWFESLEVMRRSIASSAYQMLAADTPTVMTMPGIIAGIQERVFGDGVQINNLRKLMIILGRRRSFEPEAFRAGWRELAASVCARGGATAAVTTIVSHREAVPGKEVSYEALPIDVVGEFWFEHDGAIEETLGQNSFRSSAIELAERISAYAVQTYVIVP
jgi:uncharacterized protein (TIGR02118 family)